MQFHERRSCLEGEDPRVQRLDGLTALCPACYELPLVGLGRVRGRLEEAKGHLVVVHRWDRRRDVVYLDECERTWLQRSRRDWSREVSWLTKTVGTDLQVTPCVD